MRYMESGLGVNWRGGEKKLLYCWGIDLVLGNLILLIFIQVGCIGIADLVVVLLMILLDFIIIINLIMIFLLFI